MSKQKKQYKPHQHLQEKAEAFCQREWGITLDETMLIRYTCMYIAGYFYVEPDKSTNKKPYHRIPKPLIDAGVLQFAGRGCARRYVPDHDKVAHYLALADLHGLIYPSEEDSPDESIQQAEVKTQ